MLLIFTLGSFFIDIVIYLLEEKYNQFLLFSFFSSSYSFPKGARFEGRKVKQGAKVEKKVRWGDEYDGVSNIGFIIKPGCCRPLVVGKYGCTNGVGLIGSLLSEDYFYFFSFSCITIFSFEGTIYSFSSILMSYPSWKD